MPNWAGGGPGDYLEVWDMGPAAAAPVSVGPPNPSLLLPSAAPPDVKPTPSDLRIALDRNKIFLIPPEGEYTGRKNYQTFGLNVTMPNIPLYRGIF